MPFPSPGDLPNPGIEPGSPALQADALSSEPPGKPKSLLKEILYTLVSEVAQSCLTLCDPIVCSLPGSSVHGIFQARILEWIAISFSMKPDLGFPGGSEDKASACKAGDPGSIPGLGRSPGEGNGNPLQYSCLENPMDGEFW